MQRRITLAIISALVLFGTDGDVRAVVPMGTQIRADSVAFNEINAYIFGTLSQKVYIDQVGARDEETFQRNFTQYAREAGFTGEPAFIRHQATNTEGVLVESGPNVVLSFRGTEVYDAGRAIGDLATSLSLVENSGPEWDGGRVHGGYAAAALGVLPQVLQMLKERRIYPGGDRAIWLTGHSLGGAVGALVAYQLARLGYRIRGVYVYGSPAVGDDTFYRNYLGALQGRHFPVANRNDPVVTLPVVYAQRVGQIVHLMNDGKIAFRRCRSFPQATRDWMPDLADHDLPRYLVHIYQSIPEFHRNQLPPPQSAPSSGRASGSES